MPRRPAPRHLDPAVKQLLCWLTLTSLAQAAPGYHQKIPVDLNGDGRPEQVALRRYQLGHVPMAQLVVLNAAGQTLWSAPRVKDAYADSPWAFLGEFDLGDISWVDDYDGNGQVDLCATCQKSDMSPTRFKLFHWDGKRFVYDRTVMLVNLPQKPATFGWKPYDPGAPAWVNSLKKLPRGGFEGDLFQPPQAGQRLRLHYEPGEGFIRD